jgi:hypothetical protein
MADGPELLRFYPSRPKLILFAAFCAVGVALGIWIAMFEAIIGGLFIAFCGFGVLILSLQLLPNSSYLEIRGDGFTMRALYREHNHRWDDVQQFFPVEIKGNRMTGVVFHPNFAAKVWGSRMSQSLAGCDGAIPEYGVRADKMAEILNECLVRFRATSDEDVEA